MKLNEKTIEILFNKSFLSSFNNGSIVSYSPSTVEEAKSGFDGSFSSNYREIYFQFKIAEYLKSKQRFRVPINPKQHKTLLTLYGKSKSAYYVFPIFKNLQECILAQKQMRTSKEFLIYYYCLDIDAIDQYANEILFAEPAKKNKNPDYVKYIIKTKDQNLFNKINTKSYNLKKGYSLKRATIILSKYKEGKIGINNKSNEYSNKSVDQKAMYLEPNTEKDSSDVMFRNGSLLALFP